MSDSVQKLNEAIIRSLKKEGNLDAKFMIASKAYNQYISGYKAQVKHYDSLSNWK